MILRACRRPAVIGAALTGALGLAGPGPARAQPAPEAGPATPAPALATQPSEAAQPQVGVQDIVVTALRRSEPLQKTAASVSVIDGQQLEDTHTVDLTDLAKIVPNLNFNEYFRAGVPYLSLRGIPTSQGGEAPVAFIVDGAQAPGLDFINVDLVDIADIQVLRGPQGAIYGRGAIAGAIVINTTQPTDTFHDTAISEIGNGGTYRLVNVVSGPIVPGALWGKVTVQQKGSSGLIEDEGLNKPGDWYKETFAEGQLLFKPNEGTTFDLHLSHLQGIDGASYLDMVPNGGIYDFNSYFPNRNLDTTDHRAVDHAVLRADQATPFGTLTSISQYAEAISKLYGDADWTPSPVAVQYNKVQVKAFNQDLRLSSPADQPVTWLVGGFFQYRDTVNYLDVFSEAPGVLPPGLTLDYSNEDQKSFAYAVYAQANVDLPLNLKLSGALRYDIDDRYDDDRSVAGSAVRTGFDALQPSVTLSEQFSPDVLGYLTSGRGFRSGGFNALADTEHFPALVKREFPEETAWNYEGGVKTQFFDKALTVNASIFHTDYRNEQYYFVNITPPSRDIISIGRVSINGGELEVDYRPISALTLVASLGVADSNIDSDDGPYLADHDKHSPNANTYNWDVGAVYNMAIAEDWFGFARADVQALGPIYYDPANQYDFHPTYYLSGRAGVQWKGYSLALWGKNLTNTRSPTVFGPQSFGPGNSARQDNEPASFGVELTARF